MTSMGTSWSTSCCRTPTWLAPRSPPPLNTTPIRTGESVASHSRAVWPGSLMFASYFILAEATSKIHLSRRVGYLGPPFRLRKVSQGTNACRVRDADAKSTDAVYSRGRRTIHGHVVSPWYPRTCGISRGHMKKSTPSEAIAAPNRCIREHIRARRLPDALPAFKERRFAAGVERCCSNRLHGTEDAQVAGRD
jgi:hypothetical protein